MDYKFTLDISKDGFFEGNNAIGLIEDCIENCLNLDEVHNSLLKVTEDFADITKLLKDNAGSKK